MRKLSAIILAFAFVLALVFYWAARDNVFYDVALWIPVFVLIGTIILFTSFWFERFLDSLYVEVDEKIIQSLLFAFPITVLVVVSVTGLKVDFPFHDFIATLLMFVVLPLTMLGVSWLYLSVENKVLKGLFYVMVITSIMFAGYLHIGTWITGVLFDYVLM